MSQKMPITVCDPWLGERELEPGSLGIIKDQLRLLRCFRDDGRIPGVMLLEDIKVFEFIVGHPQAQSMAEKYFECQFRLIKNGNDPTKMDIAKTLGWFSGRDLNQKQRR